MGTRLLAVTEARNQILKIVRTLEKTPERFIITREGHPRAVMLSYEEFQGLLATAEILADPHLKKGVEEGLRDLKAGKIRRFEDVFDEPL